MGMLGNFVLAKALQPIFLKVYLHYMPNIPILTRNTSSSTGDFREAVKQPRQYTYSLCHIIIAAIALHYLIVARSYTVLAGCTLPKSSSLSRHFSLFVVSSCVTG